MRRCTTPTVTIHIDESLSGCEWFRVTFAQKDGARIVKDQDDCELSEDGKEIRVTLTQDETLRFNVRNDLRVQVRFGSDGSACASDIASVKVLEILDEEVI